MFDLQPPRHIPTLPIASVWPDHGDFRSTPVNGHAQDRRACLKGANTGLGRCDHLIDFAPYANTQRTKPSDFARDALGVSDDAALQELSGQRRSRDKDWPPRD
jgi:hypothetical protein